MGVDGMSQKADKTFSKKGRATANLTGDEKYALARWFMVGMDMPDDETQRAFELAHAQVSCKKWAKEYGVKVIAMMVDKGVLKPGQNPVHALQEILETYE